MTVSPRTCLVGEVVTAALLNGEIRDQFNSMFGAWSTWSPTWGADGGAAPTLGNGTLTGRYLKVGRTVDWVLQLTWGSTTAPGGGGGNENWWFGLPALPATGFTYRIAQGDAYDASSGLHYGATAIYNTGNGGCVKTFVASQGTATPVLDSLAPFTWAASDILYAAGRYEAAS
ncbi:hypothetical protein AB0H77_08600 [Streptomyces sp. NPDC050844]|uniref:hypothetical protein n=1 Tax=Streptomyces sp. NPDC050844 TaxID=3155790 RepID=UPI00340E9A28